MQKFDKTGIIKVCNNDILLQDLSAKWLLWPSQAKTNE